jgi:hypothetical protein
MSLAHFRRKITNTTFLRWMHVTQGMADGLGRPLFGACGHASRAASTWLNG